MPQMHVVLQFEEPKYAPALADGSSDDHPNVVQEFRVATANDTQRTHEVWQSLVNMDEAEGEQYSVVVQAETTPQIFAGRHLSRRVRCRVRDHGEPIQWHVNRVHAFRLRV